LRCKNLIAVAAAAAAAADGAAPPSQQEVCNGLVQEVEEEDPTVNEDDPNSDPLHPFACSRCGERFNAMKAKDVHEVECAKKVTTHKCLNHCSILQAAELTFASSVEAVCTIDANSVTG
jgi:hypothetical protein